MNISVVIPCYRSRGTLPKLAADLLQELPKVAEKYEIIFVVDGSPDDTYTVARQLEREHPDHIRALLLRRNYGQHNALLAGFVRARYGITVTMDDDLQHRADQLPTILEPLTDPLVDLVYAVPREEEHGVFRSFASRTVKAALSAAGVASASDVSAFRAFRTDLRDGFAHVADQFANIDVLLSWTTTAIERVVVEMDVRREGRSGYTFSSLVRHAMNMITGYGTVPLKLVSWLGLLVSFVGFLLLVYVVAQYFRGAIEVAGFTTLASMLALLSGAMMLSIGILGEYLGRLHFRSMQRPSFLVRVDSHLDGPRAGLPGTQVPRVVQDRNPDDVARAIELRLHPNPLEQRPAEAHAAEARPGEHPGS